ncbi:hypothetical protein BGZ54_010330 [Gamsiella multidivaricata]|nr:hypothetical protein BGZ54_010330 [Gamsiella multidivaricata]
MDSTDLKDLSVIIVGAGLGGVMLGLLLEKLGISYTIFERAKTVKPLGPVTTHFFSRELDSTTSCFRRSHPIRYSVGKKVLSVEETEDHALINCSDGTRYFGDIVVGADGAYSGVRQSLYKKLQSEGQLPNSDTVSMNVGFVCTVGTTNPMDPEKIPLLKDGTTKFCQYRMTTVNSYRICWTLSKQHINDGEGNDLAFRNSEWAPETVETSLKEFYNLPCPFGGTMKDIIDATPRELVSKVFLEEKLFETWHHGRVVLLGDGAMNAMQDAVILANCLYDLKSTRQADIKSAFSVYHEQRYPFAKAQVESSRLAAKLTCDQNQSVDRTY